MRAVRSLLAPLALLCSISCENVEPERLATSSNQAVTVSQITTFDDCTLYRVENLPHTVYVTRCGGQTTTQANWKECHPCGKSTCCQDKRSITEAVNRGRAERE
jgi:hypothetical protein